MLKATISIYKTMAEELKFYGHNPVFPWLIQRGVGCNDDCTHLFVFLVLFILIVLGFYLPLENISLIYRSHHYM